MSEIVLYYGISDILEGFFYIFSSTDIFLTAYFNISSTIGSLQ